MTVVTALLLVGYALAAVFCLVWVVGGFVLDRRLEDIEKEWRKHGRH